MFDVFESPWCLLVTLQICISINEFDLSNHSNMVPERASGAQDFANPKLETHPMLARRDWASNACPVDVLGDGGRFTDKTGLYTMSWSFKLARGIAWHCGFTSLHGFLQSLVGFISFV